MIGPSIIIPVSRAKAIGILWFSWAIFGNDEDGICGERGGVPGYAGVPVTWWNWLRWWLRNPLHNLTHHVLAIPFDGPGRFWPSGHGWQWSWNGGPLIAFRGKRLEGYAGFRPRKIDDRWVGVFGLSIRRNQEDSQ